MKHRKGKFLSGMIALALVWASSASATLIYDVITEYGIVGQIGFEGLSNSYAGTVDEGDVSSFSWDASVIGDTYALDPNQWLLLSLWGNLDATNSTLNVTSFDINYQNGLALLYIDSADAANQLGTYWYGNIFHYKKDGRVWLEGARSSVPEPMVLVLLSMGLVGVGAATRRNKKHQAGL